MMRRGFYFHTYKDLDSWALYFGITTRNASVQIGPFLLQAFWRLF